MGIYYFKDTCLDFLTYFLPSEASICVYPGRGPKIRGLLRHFTNELLLCSNFVSKMTK